MSAALYFIRPIPTILVALYFYFFLRRAAGFWGAPMEKKRAKLIVGLAALAIGSILFFLHSIAALFVLMILLFGLLMDLLHLIVHYPLRKTKWSSVWRCGLIPVAIAAVLVTFGFFHMRDVHETHYQVVSEKISTPTRILFLSDLHSGNAMDHEKLAEYCKKMQESDPDVVILGGDIVDENTTKEGMQQTFATLGSIESTYGTFYVFGNHDRASYSGNRSYTPQELEAAITGSGITILRDSSADLGILTLIGRNDRSGADRTDVQELCASVNPAEFLLLVDHQPFGAEENAAYGIDLMLSGHTHNGQIWPIGYVNSLLGPKYGEYHFGSMELIVSSGICGWGFPVRTQGVSEYVIIDLLPAD